MTPKSNLPTVLAIVVLASISLSIIFSINKQLAANQLTFWILGFLLFWLIHQGRFQFSAKFTILFYLATIVSLTAVFFIGEEIRGSTRWIDLGIFRFQPSEVAKLTTILALSHFYTNKSAAELAEVIKSLAIIAPILLLVFIEPDIGSALSVAAIWAGMTYVAKISLKSTLTLLLTCALIFPLLFNFLAPYQRERLISFINPGQDPLGAGYNIIQSKIAIGAGQLFGQGLGRGSQSQLNFLPEAESDFIFASIVEEFGLIGGVAVVLTLTFIILSILQGFESYGRFQKLLKAGIISLLAYQTSVNVGMNLGLIPVTGITLPMVSYGGSSLIVTLILLAIATSLKR